MAATDGAIFTNVEDFVGALQEARTELVVTGPGVFWARLTRVVLPHLNLLAVSEVCSAPPILRGGPSEHASRSRCARIRPRFGAA